MFLARLRVVRPLIVKGKVEVLFCQSSQTLMACLPRREARGQAH